ncbi:MAG: hypothetical protein ABIT76_08635 [Chthoniobacterales bacterium]
MSTTVLDFQTSGRGLKTVISRLHGAGRRDLLTAAITEVQEVTRIHLRDIASTRHATAQRLGASPTGHLAQAAEKVAGAAITADENEAALVFNHPGLSRAFRDVTITPTKSKALTIPIAAVAYGRRAGEFAGLFLYKGKTGNAFLALQEDGKLKLLYLLLRSVTQKQDRSLLPSQEQWSAAAVQGAKKYVREALS